MEFYFRITKMQIPQILLVGNFFAYQGQTV